jgi:hypothetical protein
MATINISTFLTENSTSYYRKVIDIINSLSQSTSIYYDGKCPNIYIFGGFIRNLIEHYYLNDTYFSTPNDIDIWFDYSDISYRRTHSYTSWSKELTIMLENIKNKYNLIEFVQPKIYGIHLTYGLSTIKIDDITFDLCTKVNHFSTFNTLCDFTCNNLYIDLNGNLHKKIDCLYTIQDSIEHIKNKKLINIINQDIINKLAKKDEDENNELYNEYMKRRETKMLTMNYSY